MKIAFFAPPFPKRSETFIVNQVVGLLDAGHDVTVFADDKPEKPLSDDRTTEYDLADRTIYSRTAESVVEGLTNVTDALPRILTTAPNRADLVFDAARVGRTAPNYLQNLATFLDHGESFDLCHAHFGIVGRKWSFVSDLPGQGPFLTTFYGFDVTSLVHPDHYDYYERFWSRCDACIGISQHIRSRMIMLGCPEEQSIRHPIGVDVDRFDYTERRVSSDEPLRIASVARFAPKKGLQYAIDAVAQCRAEGRNVEYHIAGDGPLRSSLESRIADHGIEDSVTLLGWQTPAEVNDLLHRSHLFIQPSVTTEAGDMEGQALVFQEAQATGLPVVGTYHDGIPEGVSERESGLLVPERDVEALADAIAFFDHDRDRVPEYGRAGRRLIEEEFDNNRLTTAQARLYQSVIDSGSPTSIQF